MRDPSPSLLAARVIGFLVVAATSACMSDRSVPSAQYPFAAALQQEKSVENGKSCRIDGGLLANGSRDGAEIALSFDLCPTSHVPSFAPDVVAYLKEAHVPATFFVSGAWARANPDDAKLLSRTTLFEVALHGDHHLHLAPGAPDAIRAEIDGGRQALLQMGIRSEPLFRPPFGDAPPELASVSREEGVLPIGWDVAPGDPDPSRTAVLMERDAIRWVQAGSIIVLHANGRGVATAETVRELVPALRARGYVFVPVSKLASECRTLPVAETRHDDASRS